MEDEPFSAGFNKIFKSLGKQVSPETRQLQLDLNKKLWDFFLVGDSYYFIINHPAGTIEFVSEGVEDVMGYMPSEFSIPFINEHIHPDDRSWFLVFGEAIIEFLSSTNAEKVVKYKVRYDIRLRKKDGNYARILCQAMILERAEDGRMLRSLSVHCDISYLKRDGRPVLSFIGMDGESSYYDVASSNVHLENEELTRREKQVLALLIEGKFSKEISNILHISKQTVDTHRKNMLHKKHLSNTSELVGKAIKGGWV